jgi:hypothetical protein
MVGRGWKYWGRIVLVKWGQVPYRMVAAAVAPSRVRRPIIMM